MKRVVICVVAAILILTLNVNLIFSEKPQSTELGLVQMRKLTIDGGQPIVFVGKLTNDMGDPVTNATIFIKNNQDCPNDQIVGTGITDKRGSFTIYAISKIWNEKTNLVKFHAEFNGTVKHLASVSNDVIYMIFPSHAQKCAN